jgi:hypothetical protein
MWRIEFRKANLADRDVDARGDGDDGGGDGDEGVDGDDDDDDDGGGGGDDDDGGGGSHVYVRMHVFMCRNICGHRAPDLIPCPKVPG